MDFKCRIEMIHFNFKPYCKRQKLQMFLCTMTISKVDNVLNFFAKCPLKEIRLKYLFNSELSTLDF